MIELSITIKDEDRTFTRKELLYDPLLLSRESPELVEKIAAVLKEFRADPNEPALDIIIKTKMTW